MVENRNDPANQGYDSNNSFVSRQKPEIAVDKQQRPFVEVIERHDSIVVLVEIHGYEGSDIKVSTDGARLIIGANALGSSWSGNVTLPTSTDPNGAEARYNHGTLEVTLRKGYYSGKRLVLIDLIQV